MIDRYDSRGRLLDEPDDLNDDQPECCCGAALPAAPSLERRIVGYPDEFHDIEVREYRDCQECGCREWGDGWYE